jgi:hypothetical protein
LCGGYGLGRVRYFIRFADDIEYAKNAFIHGEALILFWLSAGNLQSRVLFSGEAQSDPQR